MNIQIGTFAELSAIVAPLREAVFFEEQGIPRAAIDEWYNENETTCAVFKGDTLVATTRLTETDGVVTLGQVATLKSQRGKGYGKIAVDALFDFAKERGISEIIVHAQKQAEGFYQKVGFVAVGEPYYEGEFELVDMRVKPIS
ncbi:N-acetyltransferase [Clostridia bacterium]|nr:N-acetyltransferase [Clostridia bacterium]